VLLNLPQMKELLGDNEEGINYEKVKAMVQAGQVLHLEREGNGSFEEGDPKSDPKDVIKDRPRSHPLHEGMLYKKGKMSNSCTVILKGQISLLTYNDSTPLGPWTGTALLSASIYMHLYLSLSLSLSLSIYLSISLF
jgi:hypothetical protein